MSSRTIVKERTGLMMGVVSFAISELSSKRKVMFYSKVVLSIPFMRIETQCLC